MKQWRGRQPRQFDRPPSGAAASGDSLHEHQPLYDEDIYGDFPPAQTLNDSPFHALESGLLGSRSKIRIAIPLKISGRPQQTVSQSAASFEKIQLGTRLKTSIAA